MTGLLAACRSGQSPLNRPASVYSGRHGSSTDAKLVSPRAKAKPASAKLDDVSVAFVAVLFLRRGPVAITRLVVAVAIAPLDCVLWGRGFTHVCGKVSNGGATWGRCEKESK